MSRKETEVIQYKQNNQSVSSDERIEYDRKTRVSEGFKECGNKSEKERN